MFGRTIGVITIVRRINLGTNDSLGDTRKRWSFHSVEHLVDARREFRLIESNMHAWHLRLRVEPILVNRLQPTVFIGGRILRYKTQVGHASVKWDWKSLPLNSVYCAQRPQSVGTPLKTGF